MSEKIARLTISGLILTIGITMCAVVIVAVAAGSQTAPTAVTATLPLTWQRPDVNPITNNPVYPALGIAILNTVIFGWAYLTDKATTR